MTAMGFETPGSKEGERTFEASEMEKTLFKEYLEHLDLSEEELLARDVLDVGAGSRMFSAHLLREGLTDRAYSLEPNVADSFPEEIGELDRTLDPEKKKMLDARTVQAAMEAMPFKDGSMDLIVGHGAVPGLEDMETVDGFDEIVRVLRPGGEARLYPLHRAEGSWESWREKVDAKLEEFRKAGFDVRVEEASRRTDAAGRDVVYDRVIIRKNKPE